MNWPPTSTLALTTRPSQQAWGKVKKLPILPRIEDDAERKYFSLDPISTMLN